MSSEGEKIYLIDGIQDNIRIDGRENLDYRSIEFETGVINTCNGSCLLKIEDTKLLAGVKAELTSPPASSPDRGWIEVSIESTPHACLEFEGKGGDDFAADVSQLLTQVCNNDKLIDLKSLCVIPGQQVWVLYVDIMVLGYEGNLIDAASLATKAALFDTKIQSVGVKSDGEEPEIVVSDDPYDVFSLNVSQLPLMVTLHRVGSEFIIDATSEEEECSICKLVLAVSPEETVMMKLIGGSGSLHIGSIETGTEVGQEFGKKLQKSFGESLEKEKNLHRTKKRLFNIVLFIVLVFLLYYFVI